MCEHERRVKKLSTNTRRMGKNPRKKFLPGEDSTSEDNVGNDLGIEINIQTPSQETEGKVQAPETEGKAQTPETEGKAQTPAEAEDTPEEPGSKGQAGSSEKEEAETTEKGEDPDTAEEGRAEEEGGAREEPGEQAER
ncbi:hypothetical protein ACOMHN_027627 [Nucella lapillus]